MSLLYIPSFCFVQGIEVIHSRNLTLDRKKNVPEKDIVQPRCSEVVGNQVGG